MAIFNSNVSLPEATCHLYAFPVDCLQDHKIYRNTNRQRWRKQRLDANNTMALSKSFGRTGPKWMIYHHSRDRAYLVVYYSTIHPLWYYIIVWYSTTIWIFHFHWYSILLFHLQPLLSYTIIHWTMDGTFHFHTHEDWNQPPIVPQLGRTVAAPSFK